MFRFYILCFTLLSQLIHSILNDDVRACYQVIIMDCLSFVTHDCESHDV